MPILYYCNVIPTDLYEQGNKAVLVIELHEWRFRLLQSFPVSILRATVRSNHLNLNRQPSTSSRGCLFCPFTLPSLQYRLPAACPLQNWYLQSYFPRHWPFPLVPCTFLVDILQETNTVSLINGLSCGRPALPHLTSSGYQPPNRLSALSQSAISSLSAAPRVASGSNTLSTLLRPSNSLWSLHTPAASPASIAAPRTDVSVSRGRSKRTPSTSAAIWHSVSFFATPPETRTWRSGNEHSAHMLV